MNKKICAFLAAMTLATQFTGCWLFDDDDYAEDTTSTTAASTEVTTTEPSTEVPTEEPTDEPTEEPTEETTEETEAPTEETTDITTEPVSETTTVEDTTAASEEPTEPTTGSAQGGPPQQNLNLDVEYDESKFLTYVDMPECKPDASVKESDFTGYWVCDVMAKGDVAYNAICDIPVYATGRLAINAHNAAFDEKGSGMFVNIKPVVVSDTTQGGPPQQAAAQQQQATASEPEKTTLPLEYTFENGILMASVTIPVGRVNTGQFKDNQSNVMQQTPAIQGPPPKQMALQMTDDGRILVQTTGADGVVTSAYYKKVESFEPFDFASVHFDFESVYQQ